MNYNDFLSDVDATYFRHSFEWRYGQTIMNILSNIWPEKYKEISGSQYDCFYDDGIVSLTLDKLKKEWK